MCNTSIWQKKPVRGLLLLLSSAAAECLFLAPSSLVSLILLGILGLTALNGLIHWKEPVKKIDFRIGSLILTLSFACIGFLIFPENMAYHYRMTTIAERLHIPYLVNARILAGVLSLIGFYAFYRLALCLEELLIKILQLPLQRPDSFPISNLIFSLSAFGFFMLEPQWDPQVIVSAIAGTAFSLVIALHSPEFLSFSQSKPVSRRLLAGLTAIGIVLFRGTQADAGIFAMAAGVLALPFLYICLIAFYSWLDSVFETLGIFQQVERKEKLLYLGIFLAAAVFTACVFFETDAFYASPYEFDVIYTADSPKLVGENAYLSLRHSENDLRQPLFSVFAAPFLGLPWLLSCFLPMQEVLRPLLMDFAQIALLLFTNFMLGKMLNLNRKHRMLFMGLTGFSYPVLLFLLMMEQYIVVYFYLILCISLILKQKDQAELPLCAAGGTLLTGLILMPALSENHFFKEFKGWFSRMLSLVMSFILSLLCFGRLDIILNAPTQLLTMLQFSGQKLTFLQKLHQYSSFFSQCLIAPEAAADLETFGYPSWQLLIPQNFSIIGILIFVLCMVSLILNRRDKASSTAGLWLGFSFAILFILGWGTQENGLILYSLYFGWAIWVLLYRLLQKLEKKTPHFFLITAGILLIFSVCFNLPAIRKIVSFAKFYYPI